MHGYYNHFLGSSLAMGIRGRGDKAVIQVMASATTPTRQLLLLSGTSATVARGAIRSDQRLFRSAGEQRQKTRARRALPARPARDSDERIGRGVCPVAAAASAPARAARLDEMAGACSTGPTILTAPGAN
jgi:hypothetical protein